VVVGPKPTYSPALDQGSGLEAVPEQYQPGRPEVRPEPVLQSSFRRGVNFLFGGGHVSFLKAE
jgi:prepilin-type processing-associated H-X9-DG protein